MEGLYLAVLNGDVKQVASLVTRETDINQVLKNGQTYLYTAANRSLECTKILLKAQADVNGRNERGATPIFGAAYCGKVDCLRLLIESKANVDARDNMGATALCSAAQNMQLECMKILIEAKANVNTTSRIAPCPLEEAITFDTSEDRRCVQYLISMGAKGEYVNSELWAYWNKK